MSEPFVDGESYASTDMGKTWFQVGRGSNSDVDLKSGGVEMRVSRVDSERNIVYYVASPTK